MKNFTVDTKTLMKDPVVPLIIKWAIQRTSEVPYWGIRDFMRELPEFDLDVLYLMIDSLRDFQASDAKVEDMTEMHRNTVNIVSTLALVIGNSEGFVMFGKDESECYDHLAAVASYTEECILLERYKREKLVDFNYDKISYDNVLSVDPVDIDFVDLDNSDEKSVE